MEFPLWYLQVDLAVFGSVDSLVVVVVLLLLMILLIRKMLGVVRRPGGFALAGDGCWMFGFVIVAFLMIAWLFCFFPCWSLVPPDFLSGVVVVVVVLQQRMMRKLVVVLGSSCLVRSSFFFSLSVVAAVADRELGGVMTIKLVWMIDLGDPGSFQTR